MEGGYCSDTKYEEKLAEKIVQHERLIELLKIYRYDVRLGPMPLGYAGTVYTINLSVLQTIRAEQVGSIDCAEKATSARHKLPTQHCERKKVLGAQW